MQSHQWKSVVLSPGPHWGPWRGIHPEFRVNGVHWGRKRMHLLLFEHFVCCVGTLIDNNSIVALDLDSQTKVIIGSQLWRNADTNFQKLLLVFLWQLLWVKGNQPETTSTIFEVIDQLRSKLRRRQMKQKVKRKVLREEKGRGKEGKWRSGRKRGRKAEERVEKRKEGEERKRREEMGGKTSIRVFMYW